MSIQSEINRITTAVSDQESLIGEIVDALAARCVVTEPILQAKTITPTKTEQTITADTGYDGLSSVVVEATPSAILQSKTVTPTEEVQVITPDAGYDGLSSVTVEAVQGEVSRLPDGYTEVEYIQSSGTQYIDTGFKPNQDTRLVMDVDTGSSWPTEFPALFGVGNTSSGGSSNKFLTYLYKSISGVHDHYAAQTKNSSTVNMFGRHTFDKNKNNTIVDGITVNQFTYASFQQASPLALFCCLDGGSYTGFMTMKLYSCQIYDNETLARDFIPCVNASGEAGLYDAVNKKFYGNAGSGAFEAQQGGGPVLLWTNASPTSSFADQTVAVDGSEAKAYLVEARWDTSTATSQITLVRKSSSDQIISVTTSEPNSAIRFIKSATDSGITFSYHGGTGMAKCIPTRIWSVNFTL